jgi:hypothetical protein
MPHPQNTASLRQGLLKNVEVQTAHIQMANKGRFNPARCLTHAAIEKLSKQFTWGGDAMPAAGRLRVGARAGRSTFHHAA